MRSLKVLISCFIIFIFTVTVFFADDDPKAREIVKKVDELYRSTSSYGLFEMEIITPHWKRKLKIKSWSLGKEKTFMRILEPKKEMGMATLKLDKEMWNFLPKTNKVMKIPPSMMMGSWMGSDFTNDDLVKEYTYLEDYNFEIIKSDGEDRINTFVKCIPKEGLPIIWGHIIIEVKEKGSIPVSQKYYDEKGNLMREMYFKEMKKFGNRVIPSVMELIPTKKKGKKTIIRYVEAKFDQKIDKKIFTLRNLRKRI
ncbi:MAG: outer membrane lipoprotein-sorting protein [Acidobacteriota bacterium]